MKFTRLEIPEIILIEPSTFEDERGFFFESYNKKIFNDALGVNIRFVQDNQSLSKKNVLRGLHYQKYPYEQDKLISVISGEIYDVAVDIRKKSKTFGKWVGVKLSALNNNQLWIPKGFAHGFLSLKDNTRISYKVSEYYNKSSEKGINPFDPFLSINWPIDKDKSILSKKDFKNENIK